MSDRSSNDHSFDELGLGKIPLRQEGPIPPWQDITTLCRHISCSPNIVDDWVAQGILPPPRKRGDRLLWKWSEVDDYLTYGSHQASDIDRIREATKRIFEQIPKGETPVAEKQDVAAPAPDELLNRFAALFEEAAQQHTLFVTDAELIRRLGVPDRLGRTLIKEFDDRHPTFPKKLKLWGERRYWPAVKTWLDRTCGMAAVEPRPRKRSKER